MYEKNSLLLAEKIQTQFRERVNRRDRGVKREPLYVTSRVAMPSVLVELGFLTNPKEEDFLNTEQGKTYMASAIFRAFKEYKIEQEGIIKEVTELQNIISGETNGEQSHLPEKDDLICLSVQVFSSSIKLKKKDVKDFNDPFYLIENSMYKYFSGCFTDFQTVKMHQKELVNKGYYDCFVVGVHNNKKISVAKVLELLK